MSETTPVARATSVKDTLAIISDRLEALQTHAAALLAYQKHAFKVNVEPAAVTGVRPLTPMAAVHDDADGFDERFSNFAASEESHDENSRRWLLGA
ncbi:MAG: hypothetical protein HKN94_14865 [Acidimicrobiales bacterium]|nr:hypothetical protein [Acidimicrobiales bacterium]